MTNGVTTADARYICSSWACCSHWCDIPQQAMSVVECTLHTCIIPVLKYSIPHCVLAPTLCVSRHIADVATGSVTVVADSIANTKCITSPQLRA